jgi:rubrerythrin
MEATQAALNALRQAIELESKGRAFYLKAADQVTDPKGVEMFRSLADDEVLHKDILTRQLESLTGGKGWVLPEGVDKVEADLETPLFPEGKEIVKVVQPDASEINALLFAIGIENDSFNLYLAQAKAAQDPSAKQIYEYLVESERTHFNLLMLNYERLSTTGYWAD